MEQCGLWLRGRRESNGAVAVVCCIIVGAYLEPIRKRETEGHGAARGVGRCKGLAHTKTNLVVRSSS